MVEIRKKIRSGSFGRAFPFALISIFVLLSVGAFGYYFGAQSATREVDRVIGLANKEQLIGSTDVDFGAFWKAWNVINDRFVSSTTTDDQAKVYGAIAGLASSLGDPYTQFFPPVEKKEFDEEVSGQFEGVGMEIGIKEEILTVVAPLKGNPAERAGIKPGDKILKIDETLTTGMNVDEAIKRIRGTKGTTVKLLLFREGVTDPFDVSIVRDVITVPTVETIARKDGVFVIRVHSFSGVVVNQFREALREFVVSENKNLIIDLRANPGGYLEASVEMASWFLPQGEIIVSEDRGTRDGAEVYRSRGYNVFGDDTKVVVMIDEGSASASEIFAGALHDHNRATLVGKTSFGKGSVQELVPITEDTALKVTIARWLTPNGVSISKNGIVPDIEVTLTKEDLEAKRDAQLEAAAEYLKTGKKPVVPTATTTKAQ